MRLIIHLVVSSPSTQSPSYPHTHQSSTSLLTQQQSSPHAPSNVPLLPHSMQAVMIRQSGLVLIQGSPSDVAYMCGFFQKTTDYSSAEYCLQGGEASTCSRASLCLMQAVIGFSPCCCSCCRRCCSDAWRAARHSCLTGSVLPNMMDWFNRQDELKNSEVLWREKLGLPVPPISEAHTCTTYTIVVQ